MKKHIVKALLTIALASCIFFGSSAIESKAMAIPEQAVDPASPLSSLPKSVFDHVRYTTENPDVYAVFGLDAAALYNHYVTFGVYEGRTGYFIDGTAIAIPGIAVSQPEMLNLVNADRAAYGSPTLVWGDELSAYARQRAAEVMVNYQNPEYWTTKAAGGNTAAIAHRGIRTYTGENALYSSFSFGIGTAAEENLAWINSAAHHNNRLNARYVKYAAASYVDPLTGDTTWVELFEY